MQTHEKLRALRLAAGLSIAKAAAIVGAAPQTFRRAEMPPERKSAKTAKPEWLAALAQLTSDGENNDFERK